MNLKPVWRLPYTYPKQNLSEMLKEIVAGNSPLSIMQKREILIQCRERGLIQFSGEDKDAHVIPLQEITIIPQPEMNRGH